MIVWINYYSFALQSEASIGIHVLMMSSHSLPAVSPVPALPLLAVFTRLVQAGGQVNSAHSDPGLYQWNNIHNNRSGF